MWRSFCVWFSGPCWLCNALHENTMNGASICCRSCLERFPWPAPEVFATRNKTAGNSNWNQIQNALCSMAGFLSPGRNICVALYSAPASVVCSIPQASFWFMGTKNVWRSMHWTNNATIRFADVFAVVFCLHIARNVKGICSCRMIYGAERARAQTCWNVSEVLHISKHNQKWCYYCRLTHTCAFKANKGENAANLQVGFGEMLLKHTENGQQIAHS